MNQALADVLLPVAGTLVLIGLFIARHIEKLKDQIEEEEDDESTEV